MIVNIFAVKNSYIFEIVSHETKKSRETDVSRETIL